MKDSQSNSDGKHAVAVNQCSNYQQLESNMKKNSELYKDLFIEALDGIVFWNDEEGVIAANEAACRIFESSLDELRHRKIEEFLYDLDNKYQKVVDELARKGYVRDELVFLMPNGQRKMLEFTVKLHSVDKNHMTIFRNVTERYEMEQELRERERKFRKIFEGSVEGLLLWNDQYEIVDINPAGELMFKKKKSEIIGQSLVDILAKSEVHLDELTESMNLLQCIGQSKGIVTLSLDTGEKIIIEHSTKDGVFSNLNLTTFRDITDKLRMEEELRKSDTLNVVGQLAAGIAHEIRNPMTALKGFIQLLEDTIKEDHSMYFGVIKSELNRIDSIINEFLILAKPQVVKFMERDIVQIISETIELLQPQAVLHNVQFLLEPEGNIPYIYCEANQLKKVFINIIKNAIEVMHAGGAISVKIKRVERESVLISISDEGEGISPDKLSKLGEPFYTTKEKGTGLGLMVSFQIIREHNGKIEIVSEEGKGTTFNIHLPISKEG